VRILLFEIGCDLGHYNSSRLMIPDLSSAPLLSLRQFIQTGHMNSSSRVDALVFKWRVIEKHHTELCDTFRLDNREGLNNTAAFLIFEFTMSVSVYLSP
jgi:hypothetical protein